MLGFNTLDGNLDSRSYKGATLGRYANRISEGVFNLKGIKYRLTQNKYANHLQDGFEGFNKKICRIKEFNDSSISLGYNSYNDEEGYPGNLDNELRLCT